MRWKVKGESTSPKGGQPDGVRDLRVRNLGEKNRGGGIENGYSKGHT